MTLCIAAACQEEGRTSIVTAFDAKVSSKAWSSETEQKVEGLHPGKIAALFSGNIPEARELGGIYRRYLADHDFKGSMLESLRAPLAIRKQRIITSIVRRRLGLTYQEFLDQGQKIDPSLRTKIFEEIDNSNIEVDLIIMAFTHIGGGRPNESTIFRMVLNDVQVEKHFACIGDGMSVAEQALHRRKQNSSLSLERTLYHVYEAKKLGEISPTVGSKTWVAVLTPNNDEKMRFNFRLASVAGERILREHYKKFGLQKVTDLQIPSEGFFNDFTKSMADEMAEDGDG
jgi:20S proteasome alpha/beta subunit